MENLYLEIEQILTDEQREKWQPIMVRRIVESEQEARQLLPELAELLFENIDYIARLHICRHESGGKCEEILL